MDMASRNKMPNNFVGIKRVSNYPARRAAWTSRAFPTDMCNMFHVRWMPNFHIIWGFFYRCKLIYVHKIRNCHFFLINFFHLYTQFMSLTRKIDQMSIKKQRECQLLPNIWEINLSPLKTPFNLVDIYWVRWTALTSIQLRKKKKN